MEKSKIARFISLLGDILEKPMIALDKFIYRLPLSQKFKDEFSVRKYGVLGTVSFHLIIIILILAFKINTEKTPKIEGIEIDMKTLEELARLELELPDIPEMGTDNSRNIAVNQDEDRIESFEDYRNYQRSEQIVENLAQSNVDQTVKDIIEEENLDPFNDELPDLQTQELKMFRAEEIEEEQVYTGATNIYYSLEGREVVHLEVPVYKCEGGGLVKLDIRVNRRGKVEFVSVDTAETEVKDDCLLNAARNAANKTRFTLNQAAPLLQSGTLTYRFIAQ
jgi:hypothetical protein